MRLRVMTMIFLTTIGALHSLHGFAANQITIRMSTRGDKTLDPIVAQSVKVECLIIGGIASTRIDIDFYNPNSKVLEGTFELPVAPGWRLGKFELDIDGRLRAAVPVPKSTGRQAFNAVKRRGIDPALIEQTAENLFTARVYPFTAKGHRRVVITLDHALQMGSAGEVFEMPYTFEQRLKSLSVAIRVVERPAASARVEGLPGAEFVPGRNESVWRYEQKDARLQENIKVHLPHPVQRQLITARDSEGFVYAAYVKPLPEIRTAQKPAKISVVWDASGSVGKANLSKAKELLKSHLEWAGSCEVELITFNVAAGKSQRFTIRNGNSAALMQAIDAVAYDGATDINAVPWETVEGDEVLLFSDGVHSMLTRAQLPRVKGKLHAVNTGNIRNAQWLQQAALAHGGQLVDLSVLPASTAAGLLSTEVQTAQWWQPKNGARYRYTTPIAGEGVWLFGSATEEAKTIRIARRIGNANEQVSMLGSGADQVLWEDADIAALLRRSFAQQEIHRLRSLGEDEEAERVANKYGVATAKTSLIVLEAVEDYARYAIAPPAELLAEYNALRERQQCQKDTAQKARLEALVKASDTQSRWWRGEIEPEKIEVPVLATTRRAMPTRSAARALRANAPKAMKMEGVDEVMVMGYARPTANRSANDNFAEDLSGATKGREEGLAGEVRITAWDSESPYLKVLEYADEDRQKETYYKLKQEYGAVPSFYLDAAGFFEKKGDKAFAFLILSNLLEMELGSTELHRALAQALERMGMLKEAETVYRRIAEDSAFEPQSFRDLALVCEAQGKLQEAVDLLYKVATDAWEDRFDGVNLICMNELNGLLMRHGAKGLDLSAIDKRLIKQEPVDVRVVLTWSNDNSDVDLHVVLPDGDECFYGHRLTKNLGKLSNDITQGYGPEEFMHKQGAKGEYEILARLFADHSQGSVVPKYVRAVCYLHYGQPNEERHELLFRINEAKATVKIGAIRFE